MDSLYIANCLTLQSKSTSVKAWFEIYKMLPPAISLVDRSGKHTLPYNFVVYPGQELPTLTSGFSKTYEECCYDRTQQIINRSRESGLPIYIMYSGGIDSTMVLVSFMKHMTPDELKNNLVVLLNQDSIQENANFYYNHIRKNCRIMSSDQALSLLNKKQILVDGEHNDQLFGSDIIGHLLRILPGFDFSQPCTQETIVKCFKTLRLTDETYINQWYSLIKSTIDSAPCEIKTVFQFFWWFNFVFKWQSVFFRMLHRADVDARLHLDRDLIDNYVYHFFNTQDFQKWSMSNPELKIKDTWNTYKFQAKDLIYEFNKDEVYRDNKTKEGSLYRLFLSKKAPVGINGNLEYVYSITPAQYYNVDNYFNS